MNKKVIIQIVVIVGAFAAAGLVLYNGLFKDSSSSVVAPASVAQDNAKILPYGSTLDFNSPLYKRDFQFNSISYDELNPQQEVGLPNDSELITPLNIQQ